MIDTYITGSSGFIGQRLMSELNGLASPIPHEQIAHYEFQDFRRFFFLSTYGNMSHHAAHHAGNREMLQANVVDLSTVLDACLSPFRVTPESFIYVSSSSVELPVQTPYSRYKRAGEEIVQAASDKFCVVRPFSVTGVGEQKEHLIPTLIRSCMEGEEMTFTPWPVHDFVDVEDVVDGLIKLSEHKVSGVIEFGNRVPYSNKQIKEIVEKVCGKKANVKTVGNLRPYDNLDWCSSSKSPFWEPKKCIRQSIEEMVEVYEAQ